MLTAKYELFQNFTQLTSKVLSTQNSIDKCSIELCSGLVKISVRSGRK